MITLTPGQLVIWHSPTGESHLALVVEEEKGNGGVGTGWFRIFSSAGHGSKKYLARAHHMELIAERPTSTNE